MEIFLGEEFTIPASHEKNWEPRGNQSVGNMDRLIEYGMDTRIFKIMVTYGDRSLTSYTQASQETNYGIGSDNLSEIDNVTEKMRLHLESYN